MYVKIKRRKKAFVFVSAIGILAANAITSLASTTEVQIINTGNTGAVVSSAVPRMTTFAEELYTEGLNVVSMINTTKDVKAHVDFLPDGCYVSKARAGLKQGSSTKYSTYTTNGMKTVKMINNPLQEDTAKNTWYTFFK